MRILRIIPFLGLILFGSCDDSGDPVNGEIATYEVIFTFHWDAQNFPLDYPSNAHFSALIGWSHDPASTFFQPGTFASEGIKRMAEAGSTSTLRTELQTMIDDGQGRQVVVGSGLGDGTGQIKVTLELDKKNPAISLSTMIAPSPDWYVAVVNENLVENGEWISTKTVKALAFDAGTDSGATYTAANQPTNPQEPIFSITDAPLGNGTGVNPDIATVTFRRM